MQFRHLIFLVLSIAAFGSANIQNDLLDFQTILPKIRLPYIIGKHYLFDGNFRTAFSYLKSYDFQRLIQQDFAKSTEIQEIANYLGYPIDLNSIQQNVRSLNIQLMSPENFARERTFTSFIDEVVEYLPHYKFRNLIREKIADSDEFAQLYKKVMDPEFKTLVYKARNSANLAGAIKTLKNNNIDIDRMLQVAFQLLDEWKQ